MSIKNMSVENRFKLLISLVMLVYLLSMAALMIALKILEIHLLKH